MRKKAFTLIELLVTVGIVALTLGLAGGSLYYILRSSSEARKTVYRQREIMKAYAQLSRQLLCLYISPNKTYALKGLPGHAPGEDELHFLTANPIFSQGVAEVGYGIVKNQKGESLLAYSEIPVPVKGDYAEAKMLPLTPVVKGLSVKYSASDGLPTDRWQETEPPDKLEITFLLDIPGEKNFTFIIRPGSRAEFQ